VHARGNEGTEAHYRAKTSQSTSSLNLYEHQKSLLNDSKQEVLDDCRFGVSPSVKWRGAGRGRSGTLAYTRVGLCSAAYCSNWTRGVTDTLNKVGTIHQAMVRQDDFAPKRGVKNRRGRV